MNAMEYIKSDSEICTFKIMMNLVGTEHKLPNGVSVFEIEKQFSGSESEFRWETEWLDDTPENRKTITDFGGDVWDYENYSRIETEGYIVGVWWVGEVKQWGDYSEQYYMQFCSAYNWAMAQGGEN